MFACTDVATVAGKTEQVAVRCRAPQWAPRKVMRCNQWQMWGWLCVVCYGFYNFAASCKIYIACAFIRARGEVGGTVADDV